MKQANPIKTAIVIGLGASAALWLSSKQNRNKLQDSWKNWHRTRKYENLPIMKGGHPQPTDVEDSKMVEEGAMYSVQYYNEKVQS